MLTFLLGGATGYVLAQGTTRTTILNWLIETAPKVRDWFYSTLEKKQP